MSAQYWQTVGQWEEYESIEKGLQPPVMAVFKKENGMGLIASDAGGSTNFKRVPSGVFVGRCYSIIDLGTQLTDGQYGAKQQHKTRISWELFGEDEQEKPLTIEVDGKDMPMTISKIYTMSLHEKARLRLDLSAWRGRDFTDDEAKAFDICNLLDKYCMVNITESTTNGKTYSNVAGLTPLPGALKNAKLDPVHELVKFDLDAPDMTMFEKFYDKLKEMIQKSPEWAQYVNKNSPKHQAPSEDFGHAGEFDDGVPF